ncbi:hypothetical protein P4S73_11135 [Paraglaciecola sp. Hal342]
MDIVFHVSMASKQHWEFSWLVALTLLLDSIYLYWVKKNLHLRLMTRDWAKKSHRTQRSNEVTLFGHGAVWAWCCLGMVWPKQYPK